MQRYSASQLQKAFKSYRFFERYGYIFVIEFFVLGLLPPLLQWDYQQGRGWACLYSAEFFAIAILCIHRKIMISQCKRLRQHYCEDELTRRIARYRAHRKKGQF